MEKFRMIVLICSCVFFIHIATNEANKENKIIFYMVASYMLFEAVRRAVKQFRSPVKE